MDRNAAFFGLFELRPAAQGRPRLAPVSDAPKTIPDPQTGRPLAVASVELSERGVCPECTQPGSGGYVSFVSDLRLAFACPSCRKLVFTIGT
jgi:hypothetical protein